ncbi:DUF5955 family protein [Streptomyces sulphureus]|uniref:DUF5955 family protein n=1 Tax=Streptomyces sulphureus TaxID=47758 RepID=UPI00035D66DC|nr:DUF5955 family protein [Streptomyces sulphureus]
MRSKTVGQRSSGASRQEDPRVSALRDAAVRLRAELDAHQPELRDRGVAEDQLDAVRAMVRSGAPEVRALRTSLLLLTAALGSLSTLAEPLGELRRAVELFGEPAPRRRE